VAARAQRFGPNAFATGQVESRWHAFARQYADPMQIVWLVEGKAAAAVAARWRAPTPRSGTGPTWST
jgi:hypothetical protein